jgi:hypothetical protein
MKPAIRTMLTYTLLGPPIGAVIAFLIIMISANINSEFSQFESPHELQLAMLELMNFLLIYSFPIGLAPALLSVFTHLTLLTRFQFGRVAIVCAVTAVGLVSTIVVTFFFGNLEVVLEPADGTLLLLLPPLAASLTISLYLTRRADNAT